MRGCCSRGSIARWRGSEASRCGGTRVLPLPLPTFLKHRALEGRLSFFRSFAGALRSPLGIYQGRARLLPCCLRMLSLRSSFLGKNSYALGNACKFALLGAELRPFVLALHDPEPWRLLTAAVDDLWITAA